MRTFTQFFNDEYIALEDIQEMDKTIYKRIVSESSEITDSDIEDVKVKLANKAVAKDYLENEEEDALMREYLADPHSKEGKEARDKVILNRVKFANYLAKNINFDKNGFPTFDVYHNGNFYATIKLSVAGLHNVSNSLACIALCDYYKLPKMNVKEISLL